jgi:hypothetical protein
MVPHPLGFDPELRTRNAAKIRKEEKHKKWIRTTYKQIDFDGKNTEVCFHKTTPRYF